MKRVLAQISNVLTRGLGGIGSVMLGVVVSPSAVSGQQDSTVGPPPHFAASWAPAGTMIDVSRMGVLRQRVSLDLIDVPLDTAIAKITAQATLNLLYRRDVLPAGRTVSIRANGITVASALAEMLLDTGLDVMMTRGGQLVLAPCAHALAGLEARDTGVVVGRVFDEATGAPIMGATVAVEGTKFVTTAGTNGRYRLVGLPAGTHSFTAKYIGYTPTRSTLVIGPGGSIHDFALKPSVQQLEQVVVTGPLVPTEVKAIPTPITVITGDDIRRQNVMRMDQLFRGQAPGAFSFDRTANDYFNVVTVRGATALDTRSIKTYIDGIEVADPAFTALIDPNSVDRVELTRGPQASTMYGSDAIGGVLQVFTKKGKFGLLRPEGEIRASASVIEKNAGPGATTRLENSVALRGGEQRTRFHVAGYYRRDGEWVPSYRNTNWSATASAENVQGPLVSRVTALFARKAFDRPWYTALRDSGYTFFSQPLFQTIEIQSQTYGLGFTYAPRSWLRQDLVLGYDRFTFGLVQTQPRLTEPSDTLLQVIMNNRSKMSIFYYATATTKFGRSAVGTFTGGFNYYRLDGSNVVSPGTTRVTGSIDGAATVLRVPSTSNGYFAQGQLALGESLFLTAGVRAEKSPGFGKDIGTVVSPRVGAAYVRPVGPATIKVRLSYGESIRSPDPAQNDGGAAAQFEQVPNASLRPERQRGADGGLDLYLGSRASLSATYYRQTVVNLIDQVLGEVVGDPPRQRSQQQNLGRIRNQGWELEASYRLDQLLMSSAFSVTSSRISELAHGYGGNYQIGDRLFDVPRRSFGATIVYRLFMNTTLRGSMTSVGAWVERDFLALYGALFGGVPRRPSDRDYWMTYPGFTKFRFGLEQAIGKGLTGTLDVENIANTRAFEQDNLSVQSPRMVVMALRASY